MIDQKKNIKTKFGRHSNIKTGSGSHGNKSDSHNLVGVEKSTASPKRIKFIFRDGRMLSMPYAYLPTIIFDPEHDLRLKTGEFTVIIRGRALDRLEAWLSDEQVSWIRESPSGTDSEEYEVFIAQIKIIGELEM